MTRFFRWECRENGRHWWRCLICKSVIGTVAGAMVVAGLADTPTLASSLMHVCWRSLSGN